MVGGLRSGGRDLRGDRPAKMPRGTKKPLRKNFEEAQLAVGIGIQWTVP